MSAFLTLAGQPATSAEIEIPEAGVWFADVDIPVEFRPSGSVSLVVGTLTLQGTVDPNASGVFQLSSKVRVIGGAAGWRLSVLRRQWHDDGLGVRRDSVANAIAGVVGETLNGVPTDRVGHDWCVKAGPASAALTALCPFWWVDFEGVTQVADARPQVEIPAGTTYQLLEYDSLRKTAQIACDTPDAILPGTVLRDSKLDKPLLARSVRWTAEPGSFRAEVWGVEL